jgi:UDP:flavonoid glycosyltransferase YjiC (YdhE family)
MKEQISTVKPVRILFTCVPADGHFNPLTGLAKHLQNLGYDIAWYTQDLYKPKLKKLGIRHFPIVHGPQLNQYNFETYFSDRVKKKSMAAKMKFDLEHVFIRPVHDAMKDLRSIYLQFPFDLIVGDIFSFALPAARAEFNIPVIATGVIPVMESSGDLPPAGLGLTPNYSTLGKLKQNLLRQLGNRMVFGSVNKLYRNVLAEYGATLPEGNVFDVLYRSADVVLQSGAPCFEYPRSDWGRNLRFAGALLPHSTQKTHTHWHDDRLGQYVNILLVTQGTVEKNIEKLLVPTLEAYKNDPSTLVVATTGGSGTEELRRRFPYGNIIIEDFIPFGQVMPKASAYITNGGYGGVMMALQHQLPMVVCGVHEGKNEIAARVGYFKYGVDLKTEKPKPAQIKTAIRNVLGDPAYRQALGKAAAELNCFQPEAAIEKAVLHCLKKNVAVRTTHTLMSVAV